MDSLNVIIFIAAIINLILGVLIYKKGNNKKINNAYIFLAACIFFWGIAKIIYRAAPTIEASIFWDKILYVIPIYIVGSVLHFAYIFPEGENKQKKWFYPFISITSLGMTALILFTNNIIESVKLIPGQEKFMVYGDYYSIYSAYVAGYFVWSWIVMFKKIKTTFGLIRAQLVIVFTGIFISSFSSIITNVVFLRMGIFKYVWAGHILILFMVIFIAYAIIRHRLMDIKVVMRKYSVLIISIIAIIIPAIIIKYLFILYLNFYLNWVDILILIISISIYPSLKNYFFRLANKYFFSSLYDSREVISSISNKLRTTLDINKIYGFIDETLNGAFHYKNFGVLTYNPKTKTYTLEYNNGIDTKGKKRFSGNDKLHKIFISQNRDIITEEVRSRYYNKETKETIDLLSNLKIEVLSPLNVKDKTVGLIALGRKESGDMYNDEDLQVLNVVNSQAAIAIENAMLYKETLNFNEKLKKEVEKRTKELKSANEKLKQLDKAKSEFISIASHQLRTPLTVIKGYISMILEGNFGELDMAKQESLEKVYESNERLIQLVENLLNISRIESGRLQFNYEVMQFEDLVASVVEELTEHAKKKGLKLIYKKPSKKLPKVKIDQEKLRQVVMNLIDNAVKYTKKGTVTVTLKINEDKIDFCVSDSGMGINPEDLPNLFKKFSRGTGTSVVHTEGTGLGLYVAARMIKYHKGKIWAESRGVDKGSKFCFLLPIYKKN